MLFERSQLGIFDSIASATSTAELMGAGCCGLQACASMMTFALTAKTLWQERVCPPSPRV